MYRLPPLNALRAFEAAGRHLSFTKAAEELHVTPAAVSQQVRGLEDQLGISLFRRLTRALLLTDAGQAALPLLGEGFERLAAATEQMRNHEAGAPLTVSAAPSFAAKWLVQRLHRFQERHPEIAIRIDATNNIADFGRDNVDVAIRFGLGNYPGFRADRLMDEEMCVVCGPRLLNGPQPLRLPTDLIRHTLVHVDWGPQEEPQPDWEMWLRAAGIEGVDTTKGPVFTSEIMASQAAIDGHGVALVNRSIAEQDIADGRLIQPFALTLKTNFAIFLVCPERTAETPKIAAFRDWLLEEVTTPIGS